MTLVDVIFFVVIAGMIAGGSFFSLRRRLDRASHDSNNADDAERAKALPQISRDIDPSRDAGRTQHFHL